MLSCCALFAAATAFTRWCCASATFCTPVMYTRMLATLRHVLGHHPRCTGCLQGSKDAGSIGRMNLTQFKAFCTAAKVPIAKFSADRLDDIFTAVAASPAALKRKLDNSAPSTMNLADFLVAQIHVAYHRFGSMVCFPACHAVAKLVKHASVALPHAEFLLNPTTTTGAASASQT